jgi:hypothetical protein
MSASTAPIQSCETITQIHFYVNILKQEKVADNRPKPVPDYAALVLRGGPLVSIASFVLAPEELLSIAASMSKKPPCPENIYREERRG